MPVRRRRRLAVNPGGPVRVPPRVAIGLLAGRLSLGAEHAISVSKSSADVKAR